MRKENRAFGYMSDRTIKDGWGWLILSRICLILMRGGYEGIEF